MKKVEAISLLTFVLFTAFAAAQPLVPVNLRCNYWEAPLGVDVSSPLLSWTVDVAGSTRRGVRQTAYEVLVSLSAKALAAGKGDLWATGKMCSDKMSGIRYAGKPLQSSQTAWWKLRIWDEGGKPSAWSKPSQWTMGLLQKGDWQAKWISAEGAEKYAPVIEPLKTDFIVHRRSPQTWLPKLPKPAGPNFSSMLLRKAFMAKQKPVRALVHVSGMGHYELTINGKKVGDYLLAPGWSGYDKTVLYDTYDATQFINKGANAIGLIISNGLYNIQPDTVRYVKMLNTYGPLKAIAQLRLEYADGSVQIIGTDRSWQVSPGPVTYMNLYGGEDYDARLEPNGWKEPFFKPVTAWAAAIEAAASTAELKGLSAAAPPVTAIERLTPVKRTMLRPDLWVYDLGQNASVMPDVLVKGKRGAFVRIIPAELLNEDGTVDRRSVTQDGVRPAWWQYSLASEKSEAWAPKFFYQGGRYLQVELHPAPGDTALPVVEGLTGVVIHGSEDSIGTFACSNDLFNRIYKLVRWAQRSNMMTVLTDCPHREKMPWLEQYHLNGPSLRYNFDLLTFFDKAMSDMADAQLPNGFVPNIAPEYFHAGEDWKRNGFRNSPEWGSSFIIVPWQQYLFSGDVSLVQRYYERMKRYIGFLDSMSESNVLNFGLGDWYDIGPKPSWGSQLTPVSFTATAIYFYDQQVMAKMAAVLGKEEDAKRFSQKAEAVRQAFNQKFYKPAEGIYATGSNTTCALPLALNIAEPQARQKLVAVLVDSIRRRGNSFTSGEVGYRFLLNALAEEGQSSVIYDMNNQTDRPGYGYQLKMGATSLTEKWDAGVGSFGSQNHFMSGQINEWFFRYLSGIGPDESGPGFRKIIIKPFIAGDLEWVRGSYKSVSGTVSVKWRRNKEQVSLTVSVPANTSATVSIPLLTGGEITESGKELSKAKGVAVKRTEKDEVTVEVGSGTYFFVSKTKR